ncbi:TolC family protein [Fretibacter rubidus]|uniref:TolC family protein n=1 Tax=Fretibacter rubidus TaxID=570162 RepID=UPI003529E1F2
MSDVTNTIHGEASQGPLFKSFKTALVSTTVALALVSCASSGSTEMSADELASHASEMKETVGASQEAVTASINLYEAMARALKYNLDHRVSMMSLDLARRDYELSGYDMLPKVVASGGYYGRNNDAGARSLSLLSGRESLEPSTSQEREYLAGDLTASWNVLDFGLSKIRAEQLGDEVQIAEERRRKAVIEMMEDVHRAYWRAVSAERLGQRLGTLESDVRTAFDSSRALYESRRTAPMPALSYQRELNDIQGQAQRMQRELGLARMELAALMGLRPDQEFTLVMPSHTQRPRALAMDLDTMIDSALSLRPEVREAAYMARISEKDIKKATLEGLPSLEGFAGINASTNDFLFNQDWVSYGAKASWNLLKVFETPARKRKAGAKLALEKQRALATSMAVMTQVSVARARYAALMDEYSTANTGAMVQNDILGQVETLAAASKSSTQTLVRERMNAILSEARRDAVHAEMREAAANIYTSMGYDPYGSDITGREDVATLTASLEALWTRRSEMTPG